MDLNRVRTTLDAFQVFTDEEKVVYLESKNQLKARFMDNFPAVVQSDQACIAWFVAELLAMMRDVPLSKASDVLTDSAIVYALLTNDLLGWLSESEN